MFRKSNLFAEGAKFLRLAEKKMFLILSMQTKLDDLFSKNEVQ